MAAVRHLVLAASVAMSSTACGGSRAPAPVPVATVSVPAPAPVASASAPDRREEPPAPVPSAAPSPSNENEPAAPSAASSAAPSQSPRVQLGAFTSSGGLPPEVVQRIVRQRVPSYRKCYEDGLKKRADLMGRVVVRFIIDASGDVSDPIQVGQDMGDQNVATCVGDVFKTLIFPSPGNGPMTVIFPISFAL